VLSAGEGYSAQALVIALGALTLPALSVDSM
jgi:hypothetical protein